MQITIDVSEYFDWEDGPEDYTPTEEEVLGMKYKASVDGTWLRKITVKDTSQTFISIPESQIDVLFNHAEFIGAPKTRKQIIAQFIEEKVMPGQAEQSCWTNISVDGDPELEAYLNMRFELNQGGADEE